MNAFRKLKRWKTSVVFGDLGLLPACGSAGKESFCNAGDLCSIPGLEDPRRRERLSTPVF